MKKRIQPHIMCGVGDVARYVLLPGDPGRVERIASFLDEPRKVAQHRGFATYTGKVDDIDVSVCSTGIGCPSAAIAVEELSRVGGETFIRVGTTGAIQPDIEVGEIVVPTAAVRANGASRAFLPVEYPAVADFHVVFCLIEASKKVNRKVHLGVVLSSDAFYGDKEAMLRLGRAKALSVEMECSVLFILAELKGLRAGAVLAVDGNLAKGAIKGEFEPGEKTGELDERVQGAIDDEIRMSLEAVKLLEAFTPSSRAYSRSEVQPSQPPRPKPLQ
jgi:uridine phosphorylase